jgi:hypothetical protein
MESYERHDISNHVWSLLEPHLTGKKEHGVVWLKITGIYSCCGLLLSDGGSLAQSSIRLWS